MENNNMVTRNGKYFLYLLLTWIRNGLLLETSNNKFHLCLLEAGSASYLLCSFPHFSCWVHQSFVVWTSLPQCRNLIFVFSHPALSYAAN
jgi:hypothetical protein